MSSKKVIRKRFGSRLKKFRELRGITQEELGRKMGVGKATISKYELSQRDVTSSFIEELAEKYNVRPGYFIDPDEEEDESSSK